MLAAPGRVPDLQCLRAHQSAIGTPHSVSPRNRQPDQCIETVAFGLHSDPAEAIYSKATHVYNKMTISRRIASRPTMGERSEAQCNPHAPSTSRFALASVRRHGVQQHRTPAGSWSGRNVTRVAKVCRVALCSHAFDTNFLLLKMNNKRSLTVHSWTETISRHSVAHCSNFAEIIAGALARLEHHNFKTKRLQSGRARPFGAPHVPTMLLLAPLANSVQNGYADSAKTLLQAHIATSQSSASATRLSAASMKIYAHHDRQFKQHACCRPMGAKEEGTR